MDKEILMFSNIEVKKNKFYCHKKPISLKEIVSNKICSGQKKTISTSLVTFIMIVNLSYYI